MSLETIVRVREAVDKLCAEIDAGRIVPDERELLAVAVIIQQNAGPLATELLLKLARRSVLGRQTIRHFIEQGRIPRRHAEPFG